MKNLKMQFRHCLGSIASVATLWSSGALVHAHDAHAGPSSLQTDADRLREEVARQRQAEIDRAVAEAVAREQVRSLFTAATRAEALLKDVQRDRIALASRVQQLRTSADGVRLARDPEFVRAFGSVQSQVISAGSPSSLRVETIGTIVSALRDELEKPSVGTTPTEAGYQVVFSALAWAEEEKSRIAGANALIDEALTKAAAQVPAGSPTLDAVLRAADAERVRVWLAEREKLTDAARAEVDRSIMETLREEARRLAESRFDEEVALLRADSARQQADAAARIERLQNELAQIVADRRKEKAIADTQIASTENEAQRIELERRCNDAEVTALLAPFLTHGYWQPNRASPRGDKVMNIGPMSLNRLTDIGALDRSEQGLSKLIVIACYRDNDRPHWEMESASRKPISQVFRSLTPDQIERVKKAQNMLHDLGPTMVRLGKLAP